MFWESTHHENNKLEYGSSAHKLDKIVSQVVHAFTAVRWKPAPVGKTILSDLFVYVRLLFGFYDTIILVGGWDRGFGVFICDVKKGAKAEELGLRRGDQILQVNGVRFEHVTHSKALEVLRTATHLSITVKSNLLGYREMLVTPADSPRHRHRHRMGAGGAPQHRLSSSDVLEKDALTVSVESGREAVDGPKKHFMTLGSKARLKKALMKMNLLAKDLPG